MTKPKCLSMYEPYASALLLGLKTLETRSFNTNYRGELYIHTSAQIPRRVWDEYALNETFRQWVNLIWEFYNPEMALLMRLSSRTVIPLKDFRSGFQLGVIRGKCTLMDSVPSMDLKKPFERHGIDGGAAWEREWSLGDLSFGRFAWPVVKPELFVLGLPAKGTVAPILWDPEKQHPGFCTLAPAFERLPSPFPEALTFNPLQQNATATA